MVKACLGLPEVPEITNCQYLWEGWKFCIDFLHSKTFTEATVSWFNLFGCGQACSRMYIVVGNKKLAMSPEAIMEAIV